MTPTPNLSPAPRPERATSAVDAQPDAGPDSPGARTAAGPRLLKCESAADFLAALPRLTGFTADDSVFLVLFEGNRAWRALRVDLPRSDDASETGGFLDLLSEMLQRPPGVDRTARSRERSGRETALRHEGPGPAAVVLTTTQTFAEAGGPPLAALARRIERRLLRDGCSVRELCCVAPDGWISFLDPTAPRDGRPLREIEESPVALDLATSREPAPQSLRQLASVPRPDAERVAAVHAALETPPTPGPGSPSPPAPGPGPLRCAGRPTSPAPGEVPAADAGSRVSRRATRTPWIAETARRCETALRGKQPVAPAESAAMLRDASDADRWFVLLLTALTRSRFVIEMAGEIGEDRFSDVVLDIDATPALPPRPGWSVRRLISGLPGEVIETKRLRSTTERVAELASLASLETTSGVYCLLALLWWMLGLRSVASGHLETARAAVGAASGHRVDEILEMVERVVRTQTPPGW